MKGLKQQHLSMSLEQLELYERIQSFSLDQAEASLSFTKRLSREQGWSLSYTNRVIEEYKKFVFLAVVAGHPICPSEQVDQVWHQHLTYTKSYWLEFCPNILQRPLHHEPTRGGRSEQFKHLANYNKTLESYQHFFGQLPPTDIWPEPQLRFRRDTHFVRVNSQENWIFPKPDWKHIPQLKFKKLTFVIILLISSFLVISCQPSGTIQAIALSNLDILILTLISIIGLISALRWKYILRFPEAQDTTLSTSKNLDLYGIALLGQGKKRTIGVAVARLIQQGYIDIEVEQEKGLKEVKLVLKKQPEDPLNPIESEIIQRINTTPINVKEVFKEPMESIKELRVKLKEEGLLLSDKRKSKLEEYPFWLGYISLLLLSIQLYPGNLIFNIISSFIAFNLLFNLFYSYGYRSHSGEQVFKDLTKRFQDFKNLTMSDTQFPLAVAVFGTTVLATNTPYADLYYSLRHSNTASASDDGDSGCDGGCGGCDGGCGGCGDGGCGGCGGCGD